MQYDWVYVSVNGVQGVVPHGISRIILTGYGNSETFNGTGISISPEGQTPTVRPICSHDHTYQAGSSCPDAPF